MLSQTNSMMSPSDSQNQKSRTAMGNMSSSSGKRIWRNMEHFFCSSVADDSAYCDVLA